MKPRVFRARTGKWIALYRPGQYDPFDTWWEAYFHAFTIARIRGAVPEVVRELP